MNTTPNATAPDQFVWPLPATALPMPTLLGLSGSLTKLHAQIAASPKS